jgi:hypothetical protein
MTRSASKQDLLRSLGARPVVADALDPDAVARAVASAEPEVIVHQLTALSGPMSLRDARRPDRSFAVTMTNRLRTESTDGWNSSLAVSGEPCRERAAQATACPGLLAMPIAGRLAAARGVASSVLSSRPSLRARGSSSPRRR